MIQLVLHAWALRVETEAAFRHQRVVGKKQTQLQALWKERINPSLLWPKNLSQYLPRSSGVRILKGDLDSDEESVFR